MYPLKGGGLHLQIAKQMQDTYRIQIQTNFCEEKKNA
jgi:propanediol dehydratase small subunit